MLLVQKAYTPSEGRIFTHGYVHSALAGGVRSIPQAVGTAAAQRRPEPPREHPVEGTTSAVSLEPASEPVSRAMLAPESPL